MREVQAFNYIENFVDIQFISKKGEILIFEDDSPNIEVYYEDKSGFLKIINDSKNFAPKGYVNVGKFGIRFFLDLPKENSKYSFTYLKINKNEIDTIKTQFKINPSPKKELSFGGESIIREKIWFNDTLIWSTDEAVELITIIKN